MNIAIFDSGIGGLSVLYQAKRMLPEAHFLYYADEDHVPYGEKTREQILTYTDEAVRFLLDQGADAIVLACNTATSVAAATLGSLPPAHHRHGAGGQAGAESRRYPPGAGSSHAHHHSGQQAEMLGRAL